MSSWQRRYEILLPLRFHDGQPVPEDLSAETLLELERQFRAVSSETAYRVPGALTLVDDYATRRRGYRPGLLAQIWKGEK